MQKYIASSVTNKDGKENMLIDVASVLRYITSSLMRRSHTIIVETLKQGHFENNYY
jgi:hypothetical protein